MGWNFTNEPPIQLVLLYWCDVCDTCAAVHGREPLPTLDSHEVQEVRRELCQIRDKVNAILDSLDHKSGGVGSPRIKLSQPTSTSTTSQPEPTSTRSKGGTLQSHFLLYFPSLWHCLFLWHTGGVVVWSTNMWWGVFCPSWWLHFPSPRLLFCSVKEYVYSCCSKHLILPL